MRHSQVEGRDLHTAAYCLMLWSIKTYYLYIQLAGFLMVSYLVFSVPSAENHLMWMSSYILPVAPRIATGNILFRFIYCKILEPPPLPPEPEEKPSVWEKVRGWASQISLPRRKPKTASAVAVKSEGVKVENHPSL
jgi:hypothetical protein